ALRATANAVNVLEGSVFKGVVGSFTDTASLEPASHYSAVINWGDGNSSAGLLVANANGGYDIVGTNTYAEEGSYSVSVTIQDEGGAATTVLSTVAVADAPLSALALNIAGTAGVPVANVLLAVFLDAGGPEPAGNYSLS